MTTTAIPYLMFYEDIDKPGKITGRLVDIERGTSSDEYGRIQKEFEAEAAGGKPGKFSYVSMFKLWEYEKHAGIYYNSELAGSAGASFFVFALPDSDPEAVKQCCEYIRRSFDVVRLKVIKIGDMI